MNRLEELERRLEQAARRHWTYQLDQVGPEENRIWRVSIPTRGRKLYQLVLVAGIHGDEPAGVEALLRLLEHQAFPANVAIECYPCMNPEGYLRSQREDGRGRDLNREFCEDEPAPAVRYFQERFAQRCCDVYVDFHEDVGTRGFYMYEVCNDEPFGPAILRAMTEAGHEIEPGPTLQQMLEDDGLAYGKRPAKDGLYVVCPDDLPDAATAQAVYMSRRADHVLTFETPGKGGFEERVAMHLLAARTLFRELARARQALLPNEFAAAEGRRNSSGKR